jgi:hypothetical protein
MPEPNHSIDERRSHRDQLVATQEWVRGGEIRDTLNALAHGLQMCASTQTVLAHQFQAAVAQLESIRQALQRVAS